MPSPDYQELSLSLVEFEEEEVVDEDEDSTSSKASEEINEVESSSAVDDPWDHPDAFQ